MFNALRYSQELERAGFSREQAEASVNLLIDVMNENFATKSDLKELESTVLSTRKELESAILSTRKDLESTILSTRKELESAILSTRKELESAILTTRKDLESAIATTRTEVELKLESVAQRMESSVREMEYKLTIKLGTLITLALGVAVTLMKMLQGVH